MRRFAHQALLSLGIAFILRPPLAMLLPYGWDVLALGVASATLSVPALSFFERRRGND